MNVVPIKPITKVSAEIPAEIEALVRKFVLRNANNIRSSHGAMTLEKLIVLWLEDVAAAVRDGGDTWEGCHAAILLREHGYMI
jgi:hypothetical protein